MKNGGFLFRDPDHFSSYEAFVVEECAESVAGMCKEYANLIAPVPRQVYVAVEGFGVKVYSVESDYSRDNNSMS